MTDKQKAEIKEDTPNCYMFIANGIEWEPFTTGHTITETLAKNSVWLASRVTPYKQSYKPGDRILFYVAGRGFRYFLGSGEIAGELTKATDSDKRLAAKLGLEGFEQRIPLKNVKLWDKCLPITPLIPQLDFIKDKKNWGLYFRQAAMRLPYSDYEFLLNQVPQI